MAELNQRSHRVPWFQNTELKVGANYLRKHLHVTQSWALQSVALRVSDRDDVLGDQLQEVFDDNRGHRRHLANQKNIFLYPEARF